MTSKPSVARWRQLLRWSLYAVIAGFCVYRLAVFRPQPLDYPGTLRPILYSGFHWFLRLYPTPEDAFNAWSGICFVLLFVPILLAVVYFASRRNLIRLPGSVTRLLASRWLFFASMFVCLVVCRYPTLLEDELNPDEGIFLICAHKMFYDANFFRAVDLGTSGPINVYPMMLPAILGISPDFAAIRLLGILIILGSTLLLYRAVRLIADEEIARIAALPLIGAFCVFGNSELRYYSSEHFPLLLISVGLYLSVRLLRYPANYSKPVFALGLLLSASFLAKMQSMPIIAALASVAIAYLYLSGSAGVKWRPIGLFVAGAVPLMLINAVLCLWAGVWNDFWITYIQANLNYADAPGRFLSKLPGFIQYVVATQEVRFFLFMVIAIGAAYVLERMRAGTTVAHSTLVQLVVLSALFGTTVVLSPVDRLTTYAYLALLAICAVPVYFALRYFTGSLSFDPTDWFGLLALASVMAAFYSVYKASRAFVHYLLFLFIPLCMVIAWTLVKVTERAGRGNEHDFLEGRKRASGNIRGIAFVGVMIAFTVSYQVYLWGFQSDHVFRSVTPQIRPAEGEYIRSLTSADGRIFVWGWTARPYLGSGRPIATREVNVSNCFRSYNLMSSPPVDIRTDASTKIENYYRARLLKDLRANPPELFIDVISEGSWFLRDRKYYGFEQFPGINDFVKTNYVFVSEQWAQRYYLRRDLVSRLRQPGKF